MLTIALNFFTREFGGATVIPAQGHHLQGTPPRRIQEDVHIVSAFATRRALRGHLRTLQELALDFCVRFEQESVAYEIDGVDGSGRQVQAKTTVDFKSPLDTKSGEVFPRMTNLSAWPGHAAAAAKMEARFPAGLCLNK